MNKKRYRLRFGLIFGVVAFVASLPSIFMMFVGFGPSIFGGPIVTSISSLIIWPVQFPTNLIGVFFGGNFVREYIYLAVMILALIPSIFYFVIGIIVGGIYGKNKNQNSSTDPHDTIDTHDNKKIVLFCLVLMTIGLVYLTLVSMKIFQLQSIPHTFIIQ